MLPQSYYHSTLSEGADSVGGQLFGDKECPFSGVTSSGRVRRKGRKRCSECVLFLFNADHPFVSLCELCWGTPQLPPFFNWLHSSFHYASTISVKAVQCPHLVRSMVHGRIRVTSLVTNKADLLGSFCIKANIQGMTHSAVIFPIICVRIGLVLNIIIVAHVDSSW